MNKVMQMITEEAIRTARAKGNYLPTAQDNINATIKVMSGSKSEVASMEAEVLKFNQGVKNVK